MDGPRGSRRHAGRAGALAAADYLKSRDVDDACLVRKRAGQLAEERIEGESDILREVYLIAPTSRSSILSALGRVIIDMDEPAGLGGASYIELPVKRQ